MKIQSTKYKYQLNLAILIMTILMFSIGIGAILWTIYRMVVDSFSPLLSIQYTIVLLFAISTIVIAILIVFFSHYRITTDTLILYFGFVQKKYPLQKILAVKLFKQTNKLILYHTYGEDKFTVICISPKMYTSFVKSLLVQNSQILYEEVSQITDDEK